MNSFEGIKILFIAGFGPITRNRSSLSFYRDVLGLPLEPYEADPDYFRTEGLEGAKHFSLWPLASAAQSCFGQPTWPADIPPPSSWIEFDVEDVAASTQVLKARGYHVLVDARVEPWGQTVTRLLSPEGILVGLTLTPWMR